MAKDMIKINVMISFLAGVVSTIIISSTLISYMRIKGPQLYATIQCVPWEFPYSKSNKDYTNKWIDIKSMYLIDIHNKGKMLAENIVVVVPGTKVFIVKRRGEDSVIQTDRKLITCGDLPIGNTLYVTAWSNYEPIKEYAETVKILTDSGPPAQIKVIAIRGPFARLIDRAIIVVLIGSLVALSTALVWWHRKWKFRSNM